MVAVVVVVGEGGFDAEGRGGWVRDDCLVAFGGDFGLRVEEGGLQGMGWAWLGCVCPLLDGPCCCCCCCSDEEPSFFSLEKNRTLMVIFRHLPSPFSCSSPRSPSLPSSFFFFFPSFPSPSSPLSLFLFPHPITSTPSPKYILTLASNLAFISAIEGIPLALCH